MISVRQRRANCANARASTGPNTRQGKVSSSKNALRHGFSLPVLTDPLLAAEAEAMAKQIAGESPGPDRLDAARRIAEAQLDLRRVRRARHELIARAVADSEYEPPKVRTRRHAITARLSRSNCADWIREILPEEFFRRQPLGPEERHSAVLSDATRELRLLDRYERRALSRRKFAVREFDAARRTWPLETAKGRTV